MSEENKKIGDFLKEKRESKKLSTKYISQHTKINLSSLEKLEANNFIDLPKKPYVKGFVKSYAKILELDEDECLELFERTYQEILGITDEPLNFIQDEENSSTDVSKGLPLPTISVVVVVSILVLILIFSIKSKDTKIVETAVVKPKVLDASTPLKKENTLTTKSVITPAVKPQEKEQNEEQETNNEVVVEKKKVEIKKDEKEENKKEDKKEVATESENDKKEDKKEKEEKKYNFRPYPTSEYSYLKEEEQEEEFLPQYVKQANEENREIVFLNAVDGDSWITYKKDQEAIKGFTLKQGRTLLIRGEEIRLFLGNTNNIKVFHNSKQLVVKSKSGVKSLVFPHDKKSNFKLPLFIYKDGKVYTSEEYMTENNISL